MPVTCIKCGSDDTQTLAMAWQFAEGTGNTKLLAAIVQPPCPKGDIVGGIVIVGILGGAILFVAVMANTNMIGLGLGLMAGSWVISILLAILNGRSVKRHNAKFYGPAYAKWQRTWICRRCGQRMIPPAKGGGK